jgi:hypothetical protein
MEIRNEEELGPFVEEFADSWLVQFGEELQPENKHEIYMFFGFVAVEEGYTLQPSLEPIEDFIRRPVEIKNVAELSFFLNRFPGGKSGPGSWEHMINGFVGFMAERKGFTLQRAVETVEDFAPHVSE